MTAKPLPTKLGKEPLIDVVCGVSFESDVPANILLPGLLLGRLIQKQPKFETLPVAQLPQAIRDSDPNLQNAPLIRVVVDEQFTVLIGSKWLAVGCQMPYAGWATFRAMIQVVFGVLADAPSVKDVEKYSLKYVNFIESQSQSGDGTLSRFNLKIEIAGRKLSNQTTQLRTELVEPPFLHATAIISPANTTRLGGETVEGTVVDVDTHRVGRITLIEFLKELPQLLDAIHTANKMVFFDLLSETGLRELEPHYE